MPQMANPFAYQLPNTTSTSSTTTPQLVSNIVGSGQYGFGNNLPNIDAATPLVLNRVYAVVMHAPTMFSYLPGYSDVLQALIETQARSIEGIDLQYSMDSGTVPAGQDGQELNVPTNARRAQVNPQIMYSDLNGNLIWNFHRRWMRMIKDPDTQASSLAGIVPGSTTLPPHVLSMFTMDLLIIQYDTTMRPENVIDGYFLTSMWPNDIGPAGYKMQLGQADVPERTISYHAVVQHNDNTKAVAQSVASLLQLHLVDYNYATPVETQMDSNLTNAGLQADITSDLSSFTQVA